MSCGSIIHAVVLLGVAVSARGQTPTTLDVEIGWGDQARTGRWVPVFVTASDPKPRNVVLQIDWPHDNTYSARIDQNFAIGPPTQTFSLYLPMGGGGDLEATFTLRDSHSGKALASVKPYELSATGIAWNGGWNHGKLIGVSGSRSGIRVLSDQLGSDQRMAVSFLEQLRLPGSPIGYDSLDLLLLNQPDLNPVTRAGGFSISDEAQQAIVDWVRAGGHLLLWPGDGIIPNTSPLIDALPCSIGEGFDAELPGTVKNELVVSHRPSKLAARRLTPKDGSSYVPLFNDSMPSGIMKRLGLGTILVAPVNLSEIQFTDPTSTSKFWKPIFEGTGVGWEELNPNTTHYRGYVEPGSDEQLEQSATAHVTDTLGDVPGAGSFGFSYVAVALIGMMFLVGPLDWFVLRRIGRQPYTWLTTPAWIASLTIGALFIGHLVKSGNLYYRTLRLVDQAGDQTVGTIDVAAIYSPRTASYSVQAEQGWWRPAGVETRYMRSGSWKTGIDFHQTWESNLATPMSINVWNLRFLRGDTVAPGAPLLAASLKDAASVVVDGVEHRRLIGTIHNLSDHPLADVRVVNQFGEGKANLGAGSTAPASDASTSNQIAPGTEANIQVELILVPDQPQNALNGYYPGQIRSNGTLDEKQIWWMSPRRTHAITDALKHDVHSACIYARVVDAPAAAPLDPTAAFEQNWRWVRALVEVKDSQVEKP